MIIYNNQGGDLFQGGKDGSNQSRLYNYGNKTKDKNYTIMSIDAKKHLAKFKSFL